jgi:L-asparaginase II
VGPLVVVVDRGDVAESRHRVHAVAVRDGAIVASAGHPALVAFLRSAAKPIQALPVARARPDLTQEEVAIACASHLARPDQLEHVRSLLAKAPAAEEELECGPEPTPLEHNCSGKHAAMLALCRARGWPSEGYRLAEHPCQQAMLAEVARVSELDAASIPTAVDGCGVVTFALPLERAARAFSRLPTAEGGDRVAAAMRAHSELVRGHGLHAGRGRLDREGRRGGRPLRRVSGRARRRAQGRGRRQPRPRPGGRDLPLPARDRGARVG